jgi:transporter family-2 protein
MTRLTWFLAMFVAGAASALQPSINASLARRVGVLESACVSFAVGTLALLLAVVGAGAGTLRGLSGAAWWELTGGLLGAAFVSATITAVPRIGTASAMGAIIAAQLATGLILDSLGAFGMAPIAADGKRIMGVCLLLAGAALVTAR